LEPTVLFMPLFVVMGARPLARMESFMVWLKETILRMSMGPKKLRAWKPGKTRMP
jgi:hypothetical protein